MFLKVLSVCGICGSATSSITKVHIHIHTHRERGYSVPWLGARVIGSLKSASVSLGNGLKFNRIPETKIELFSNVNESVYCKECTRRSPVRNLFTCICVQSTVCWQDKSPGAPTNRESCAFLRKGYIILRVFASGFLLDARFSSGKYKKTPVERHPGAKTSWYCSEITSKSSGRTLYPRYGRECLVGAPRTILDFSYYLRDEN